MSELPRDRIDQVLKRFELLEAQMAAGPSPDEYVKLASEYAELQELAEKIRSLRATERERQDLETILADRSTEAEIRELAEAALREVKKRIEEPESEPQCMRLPKDEADEKNAILNIRAGRRGHEAAPFAGDLCRMYERNASGRGWRVEVVSAREGEAGGYKEIIAS